MIQDIRHSFPVMGTVASLVVARHEVERIGREQAEAGIRLACAQLTRIDARFSHWNCQSEIERWLRGEPVSDVALAEITAVVAECARLHERSGGTFTFHHEDGRMDTAGYVKGYGIDAAATALENAGVAHFLVGVGGDCVAHGNADGQDGWGVGIATPGLRTHVSAILAVNNQGCATSGQSERGAHLRGASEYWDSFTVVAANASDADAWATIGYVLGPDGPAWVEGQGGSWAGVRGGQAVGTAVQA